MRRSMYSRLLHEPAAVGEDIIRLVVGTSEDQGERPL